MKQLTHTPSFDGISGDLERWSRGRIAVVTLYSSLMVAIVLLGVLYRFFNSDESYVYFHLTAFPAVLATSFFAYQRITRLSVRKGEQAYLSEAQRQLLFIFELDLDFNQLRQLGLHRDWRGARPGAVLGTTATLSDFPSAVGRYHSLVAVATENDGVSIFETSGQTVIQQLR
jgi:hypothetical protein